MICYLPLTYITDLRIKLLADALGPISVNLPARNMSTIQMDSWAKDGRLEINIPSGLDASSLMGSVQAFKAWADMHGRQISDISEFYKLSQGRPPLVDENAPSQIRTQIQQFQSGKVSAEPNQLFQAALFLALAHEYDMHQESAATQLGTVAAMEAELFANISDGQPASRDDSLSGPHSADVSVPLDRGLHMGVQRLQAWASMATQVAPTHCTYVTTSSAIFDLLLDLAPDNPTHFSWHLSDTDQNTVLKEQRLSALVELGRAEDPQAVWPDSQLEGGADSEAVPLKLYLLAGLSPQALVYRLSGKKSADQPQVPADAQWRNVIIGILGS